VHKIGAVKHAVHAQKVGYDAVIACGFEEAGFPHQDNVGVMVLLPKVVESVDIPVMAAGGMVDGKTLAAVLALGGEGMMMASRFIATKECNVHPNVHKLLLEKTETDTSLQLRGFLAQWGLQIRALRNDFCRQVEQIEARGGGPEEYIPLMSGERAKKAWETGECDEAMLTLGQSIGRIYDIPTVAELVARIVKEAQEALRTSLERAQA
jgi:nitronate monooxygenase